MRYLYIGFASLCPDCLPGYCGYRHLSSSLPVATGVEEHRQHYSMDHCYLDGDLDCSFFRWLTAEFHTARFPVEMWTVGTQGLVAPPSLSSHKGYLRSPLDL